MNFKILLLISSLLGSLTLGAMDRPWQNRITTARQRAMVGNRLPKPKVAHHPGMGNVAAPIKAMGAQTVQRFKTRRTNLTARQHVILGNKLQKRGLQEQARQVAETKEQKQKAKLNQQNAAAAAIAKRLF